MICSTHHENLHFYCPMSVFPPHIAGVQGGGGGVRGGGGCVGGGSKGIILEAVEEVVDPVQFHADKLSASVSYFGCCCCWSFSGNRVLCRCRIFLFRLRILLFRKFFLSFYQYIPIVIDLNIYYLCYFLSSLSHILRLFSPVDFVFLVLLVSSFSYRWFRELSWLFFLVKLVNCCELFLFVLNYQLYGSHWLLWYNNRLLIPSEESMLSINWLSVWLANIPFTIIVTITFYLLYWLLPNKHTKNKWPWFP